MRLKCKLPTSKRRLKCKRKHNFLRTYEGMRDCLVNHSHHPMLARLKHSKAFPQQPQFSRVSLCLRKSNTLLSRELDTLPDHRFHHAHELRRQRVLPAPLHLLRALLLLLRNPSFPV